MDDKKQKILLGVLVVLVVGFGAYMFLGRGGDERNQAFTQGVAQRKAREVPTKTTADRPERDRSPTRRTTVRPAERRERETRNVPDGRRKTRRGATKELKKKKLVPAA